MGVNSYPSTEYKYAELIQTLEDYKYGTDVKCSILSIMPLLTKDMIINTDDYQNLNNIMNLDKSKLIADKINICNYVNIKIPKEYYIAKYENEDPYQGYKGDKFVIMPISGNINNYVVVGRSEQIG